MSSSGWGRALLAWYDASRRKLPWREEPTPYRVWVSEIMLQQTQVAAVLPHYERFLRRFPTVSSIARAPEHEVLRHWAGLGYYSRARNLREAARVVVARHGGELPGDAEKVRSLPGIGRYTAGAILSIAFGRPEPLVDGNVARVFARRFALKGDPKSPAFTKRAWELAAEALDRGRPGDWNQALMELGALVCVPESPSCPSCPIARWCEARRLGLQGSLPERTPKKATVGLAWKALWIQRGGRFLLWRRSEDERFLPGHWALPEDRHLRAAAEPGERLGSVRHTITRHRIRVDVVQAALSGKPPAAARWASDAEADRLLVSSLWRKAFRTARAAARTAA